MDYIIIEADKPNLHRFYPTEQPQGDFGDIDHNLVWIAPEIRADLTDAELSALFNSILLHWIGGSEMPIRFGAASVDFVRGDDGRFTIAIDAMPGCSNPACPF